MFPVKIYDSAIVFYDKHVAAIVFDKGSSTDYLLHQVATDSLV